MIGPFESKDEALNCQKYISTKFFHFLVGLAKNTQNSTRDSYRFVPLQNFKNNSNIDWSKSAKEINQQLCKIYGLSFEEINYINSMIR